MHVGIDDPCAALRAEPKCKQPRSEEEDEGERKTHLYLPDWNTAQQDPLVDDVLGGSSHSADERIAGWAERAGRREHEAATLAEVLCARVIDRELYKHAESGLRAVAAASVQAARREQGRSRRS